MIAPVCPASVCNVAAEDVSTRLILFSLTIESNRRSGLKRNLAANMSTEGSAWLPDTPGAAKLFNSLEVARSHILIEHESRTAIHAPSSLKAIVPDAPGAPPNRIGADETCNVCAFRPLATSQSVISNV